MIVRLIRARYRLQWAQVRRNAWRTALFVLIQLATAAVVVFVAISGFAAAAVGVQTGRIEGVARGILGAVFVNALVGSVILGFGTRQIFSDDMLRRYPLSREMRLVARNVLGLCEPLWLITLAAYAACAIGFWLLGVAPLWRAAPSVLLLIAASYLATRLVLTLIERATATPAGQAAMFGLFNVVMLGPMLLRAVEIPQQVRDGAWELLRITPPVAAASLVAGSAAVRPGAILIAWIAATLTAILWIEARPPRRTARRHLTSAGPGVLDRVGGVVPSQAPLVAKTLRYYLRHRGIRMNCVLTLIIGTNFAINGFGGRTDNVPLPVLLGIATFAGGMGTTMIDTNVFGFEGAGFRRLLLMPIDLRAALRAISIGGLLIGTCMSLFLIGVWSFVLPALADPRVIALMLCAAASGLLVFHGLGIWTSVVSPKPVDWHTWFKSQQSGSAQFVTLSGILAVVIILFAIRGWAASGALVHYWWAAAAVPVASGCFYLLCLRHGGRALEDRRERILSMLERGA